MKTLHETISQGRIDAWVARLRQARIEQPQTWANDAFVAMTEINISEPEIMAAHCEAVFEVARGAGWGDFGRTDGSLAGAMRYGNWDLVAWILKAPIQHDFSGDEIDYHVLKALYQGIWPHADVLRPYLLMEKANVKKLGHDLFKHNEQTYYAPLREEVISKLILLPKHPDTAYFMGQQFSYTQRVPDCYTDIDAPGAMACLVMMANAGWLDLDAAKNLLDPGETRILEKIVKIEREVERAALDQCTQLAAGSGVVRRM